MHKASIYRINTTYSCYTVTILLYFIIILIIQHVNAVYNATTLYLFISYTMASLVLRNYTCILLLI